jgi:multisubunit Na+/H+ antiporter MnhE subunit
MIRSGVLGAWLVVVWVALWADLSAANVASGVVVAAASLTVFPMLRPSRPGSFRPVAALRFTALFLWWVVRATLEVAWEVLTPVNRESEGIVELPVPPTCSDTVLVLLADAIGLTPGTVVVDVADDGRSVFVHVLHLDDPDAVRAGLHRLQTRLVEAFGSDEAVAWCHDHARELAR